MVKTRKFVEGDSTLATKVVWDDELTLIFCELCVNEVNAGNRPTTHLNSKGWENVVALFQAKTQKNYGKPQLKNKWDTLKKEWRLWRELLKKSTATGENAWAPSSGVLPSGVPMGDDTPNEGFGDLDENSNDNEGIPPNEVMDELKNMYNSFYMNYDTPELSEEAQRRIATIVTQVEHNNYHEEEEQVLSSVLLHQETYFTKQPCMDSNYTGQMWVDEVLNGHDDRCMNSFRMPKNIFHSLLHDLQTNYGLKHGKVSAMEKLALSLYILGNRESDSNAAKRFQRSRKTTRLNPLKVNLKKYRTIFDMIQDIGLTLRYNQTNHYAISN
ncbi:hypothetical protein GOBAR_AA09360 [Gossypium barbadense]|uniref:Uncharacterized protein n=1 Tax=Gossypium barbadense TaxID=3634 RepID=A0A2P5Y6U6_GOSBA|nr:hypothetical protein GOBAR_AA09360 [Gossypium barbadense]